MKKNQILSLVLVVLLVVILGVSFGYYITTVNFSGTGSSTSVTTTELMKVVYDAGTSTLNASNIVPGESANKTFKVTVTPGSNENSVKYAIKINISENTFVKCDDTNYDSITNACTKGAKELVYTLSDSSGNVIATGDLTGKTGDVVLATETKTVSAETIYNYTLEIEFAETNADQNHNTNKTFTGNLKVEFSE